MSSIATVTSKGQVTLPVEVRRALGIDAGDRLTFTVLDDHMVVRAAPDFLALAGSIPVPPEVADLSWGKIRDIAYRAGNRS
ncbi:MAG: AbrB/MazE/SpoVT family DNA-binding domain-containing protein [Actinomycetia bacterium]|nr:AbrB/MazE/SpoVT family DNA-binding domain-containing protein [Actinomycetes bacterium]